MKRIILLSIALVLTGCTHQQQVTYIPWRVKPIVGPDGGKNWAMVTCVESKENCFEAAGVACPYGYDIADDTNHTHNSTTEQGVGGHGILGGWYKGRVDNEEHFKQEWLVHCHVNPI